MSSQLVELRWLQGFVGVTLGKVSPEERADYARGANLRLAFQKDGYDISEEKRDILTELLARTPWPETGVLNA
jgi:hypothetical protein